MPHVNVRGIAIHYETWGTSGPPMVFAHGLLNSIALTERFGERVELIASKGVRVIAYDARGHGLSDGTKRPRDYTWSALAEDLVAFTSALDLGPVAVYGGSMGAGTAIMAALDHPEHIDRLILRAPPPFGEDIKFAQSIFGSLAMMLRVVGPRRTARIVAALPQVRRAQRADDAFDMRSFIEAQRADCAHVAIQGVLFGERMPMHRFDRIEQPALILTHPDDRIHPLRSGALLHERLPHARLAVAPDYGYWQTHQEELASTVAAFVQGAAPPVRSGVAEDHRDLAASAP